MNRRLALAAASAGALLASAPALTETNSADRILEQFSTCKTIPQPDQRLACFEKTVDTLTARVKSRDVTIVDRQDVQKAKRSLFGFTLPNIDLFNGGHPTKRERIREEDAFSQIDTTVASAREVQNGRVEITLADESHAVWQTTEEMQWPPKSGAKIRIKAGIMNAYFIEVGGRSYRAMRVR